MRKNKTMRAAVLLLALVLITSCFVGGTFAKYTSSATANSATATVAKWSFKVEGTEIAVTGTAPTITFDLFSTIKDSNGTDNESDVVTGKIAPGTSGSFVLNVQNSSEVTAKYSIDFTVDKKNVPAAVTLPIKFSTDGNTWADDLTDISNAQLAAGASATDVTVQWKWEFDGDHTALGIAAQTAAPTVQVTASITAEQVD